jgi:hypothetical protein
MQLESPADLDIPEERARLDQPGILFAYDTEDLDEEIAILKRLEQA